MEFDIFRKRFPKLTGKHFKCLKSKCVSPVFHIESINECCTDDDKILSVLNGELLLEIKHPETKYKYGLRLIEKIKQELELK